MAGKSWARLHTVPLQHDMVVVYFRRNVVGYSAHMAGDTCANIECWVIFRHMSDEISSHLCIVPVQQTCLSWLGRRSMVFAELTRNHLCVRMRLVPEIEMQIGVAPHTQPDTFQRLVAYKADVFIFPVVLQVFTVMV